MQLPVFSPADSARVVAQVYTTTLLTLLPLVAAALAAFLLRHSSATVRVLIWRGAVAAMSLILLVRVLAGILTLPFTAWVVPPGIAAPLVILGRAQLSVSPSGVANGPSLLLLLYIVGVTVLALAIARASWRLRAVARRATPAPADWGEALETVRTRLRITRPVRILLSTEERIPLTWGLLFPVVLIPADAMRWGTAHRDAVLRHELDHVCRWDALTQLMARILCVLFWFHPGIWWIAARLRIESELACDERVLASGVRRSDYAELLALASEALRRPNRLALPLSARGGLRARLAAIVERRGVRPLATGAHRLAAAALSLVLALPAGVAQLAPTRHVLDSLMREERWESRAYAVTRLAQRSDSVGVARAAATGDPSPLVRALAADALARRGAHRSPDTP